MELRHLRYFVAVAEELHFGRAAVRLNLAQPPLSQQIKALERELGVTLFLRNSRKVELTPEGVTFLDHAQQLLAQAERAQGAMRSARRGESGVIAIGFVTSAVYSLLPAVLREFTRQRPQVEIRCFEMNVNQQMAALEERKIQVGIARMVPAGGRVRAEVIGRESFVLALPADHPRATGPAATLGEFAAEKFIFFPRAQAPVIYDAVIASCQRSGFSPRITQEGLEIHTILAMVAAGLGVTLVPSSVQSLRMPGVVYRALPEGETEEVELVLMSGTDPVSAAVNAFIAVAKKVSRKSLV